jgi:hypothetical protein
MKWLKRTKDDGPTLEDAGQLCEHVTLIPSWDSAADIGSADKVSRYRCEGCGAQFTLDEAERLRETESARLRRRLAS